MQAEPNRLQMPKDPSEGKDQGNVLLLQRAYGTRASSLAFPQEGKRRVDCTFNKLALQGAEKSFSA